MKAEILTLPGDGIGPETVNAAVRVLERIAEKYTTISVFRKRS